MVGMLITFTGTTVILFIMTSSPCKYSAGNGGKEHCILAHPGHSLGLGHPQALLLGFTSLDIEVGDCEQVIPIGGGLPYIHQKSWLSLLAHWLVLVILYLLLCNSSRLTCHFCCCCLSSTAVSAREHPDGRTLHVQPGANAAVQAWKDHKPGVL